MKVQHLSHVWSIWTDQRNDVTLASVLLTMRSVNPSQPVHSTPSLPTAGSGQVGGGWVGTGVGKEEIPTCSASFHSLWGYSSRRWGTTERREHQTNKNQKQTTYNRHRNKTTQQSKMGWRRGRGREENAKSREQSKKKIKNNVKYGIVKNQSLYIKG